MAKYFEEPSRTFSEYLLIPGYTDENCIPANVSLRTPLVKHARGEEPAISLNIPLVSAIMQSVSNDTLAIALAREGGISFIYGSQSVEDEAAMVRRVKNYKAGFVVSDSNLTPDSTLADVLELVRRKGHNTIAVTHDGTSFGKLLGIVTSRDYRVSRMAPETPVKEFMTPLEKLVTAPASTGLAEANDIIWEHKLNSIPIVSDEGNLMYMVFRKDYAQHKENPLELLDDHKRYMVGAGINTLDYEKRVPALIDAGVDVLCIDSSEGYSIWQKSAAITVTASRWARATSLTVTVSSSSPSAVRISSRWASAAAPSASPANRRASAADRRARSSRWRKPGTSITRRRASTSPSARTAASCTTIT